MRPDHIPEPPLEPLEVRHPRCPVCGDECDRFVKNIWGNIVGCDNCVTEVDAWDELETE